MEITITPTYQFVIVGGQKTRRWRGVTGSGIECDVFVPCIRARSDADLTVFDCELDQLPQPSGPAIDLRYLS